MTAMYEADLVFNAGGGVPLPDVDAWIVIDVLRATTVMTQWFELGGTVLYPTNSPDNARRLAQELRQLGESPLLMGEVNAVPPEGFDLGNSPLKLTREIIAGHCGVMSTTNGTGALLEAGKTGRPVMATSLRNYPACLNYALTFGTRVGILCSGRKRRPSWEDTLCAGAVVEIMTERGEVSLSDSARIALALWQNRDRNIDSFVRKSEHAQSLMKLGYSDDISFACETGVSAVVPVLAENDGHVILRMADKHMKEGFVE